MGALTAILGLVAIQGQFIPGLSQLDSQGMILAYALVFGFAQQALSRLLDRQAQTLLEGLPGGRDVVPTPNSKEGLAPTSSWGPPPPREVAPAPLPVPAPAAAGGAPDVDEDDGLEAVPTVGPALDRPVEEPPEATQQDQFDLIEDTVNDRRDMTEEEEAELLAMEFGPANAAGIYGAPAVTDDPADESPTPPAGPQPGGV